MLEGFLLMTSLILAIANLLVTFYAWFFLLAPSVVAKLDKTRCTLSFSIALSCFILAFLLTEWVACLLVGFSYLSAGGLNLYRRTLQANA